MAELRKGACGDYYGSLFTESESLSSDQLKVNANYIYKYLSQRGWTKNAVAGMLGNMQAESSLNPGRWQSEDVGNTSGGYGLVQWTPASKYFDWITEEGRSDASTMDNNLDRILYELENNLQWIATDEYNFSFEEFTKSTETPQYLASAFLKCYERAGVEVEETRRTFALNWYESIDGSGVVTPGGSSSEIKKKKNFKFVLFKKRRAVHFNATTRF